MNKYPYPTIDKWMQLVKEGKLTENQAWKNAALEMANELNMIDNLFNETAEVPALMGPQAE